jgi:RNA polymerase sigma-70 factor (ECF subfamily)
MKFINKICGGLQLHHQISEHRPALYRTALAWTGDAMLADDLVQEALTLAMDKSHQLKDEAKLRPWLFTILGNCWRQYLRKKREYLDLDNIELVCDDCPDSQMEQDSKIRKVREAVAALPIAQREVVSLVDLNGFSYAEVASILGIPVGTVMSRLSRARKSLLGMLDFSADKEAAKVKHLRSVK